MLIVSGCGQPTGPGQNPCSDRVGGSEFGSPACAEVQGLVVDTEGRPVPGVVIRLDEEEREGVGIIFTFSLTRTDVEGDFQGRAALLVGPIDTITIKDCFHTLRAEAGGVEGSESVETISCAEPLCGEWGYGD